MRFAAWCGNWFVHVLAPAAVLVLCALALYWPTLSLDFHLLDEPGDTLYSFKLVEQLVAHPSIKALQSEKDKYRLTPVHYFYHYALSRVLGLSGPRHHAAHLCFLFTHLLLMVWLFRALFGSGWWAAIAGFFYLLFIPDDWNSTPYNFYTLFTLEPLVIAFLGLWCAIGTWLAFHTNASKGLRLAGWIAVSMLAVTLLFTKETAIFYAPGVAVVCAVLCARTGKWQVPLALLCTYALASLLFLACFFYATAWHPGVNSEVTPGSDPLERLWRVLHAFGDTFGPLLVLIPLSYIFVLWPAGKRTFLNQFLDLDLVGWTMMLPSLAQLVIWPNFQVRLLLPHALIISVLLTLAIYRLVRVARSSPRRAKHNASRIALAAAALCLPFYALFAGMALHNFRLLLRCNEQTRVAAYKKCRDLLEPNSRLFVAIMRGDQVFTEIGWRLQFFDKLPNRVIELQPGSETPVAGDVIYYHKRMARVKPPRAPMDSFDFLERGNAYLHVGWKKWIATSLQHKSVFETGEGGNEYTVYKVRPASTSPAPG